MTLCINCAEDLKIEVEATHKYHQLDTDVREALRPRYSPCGGVRRQGIMSSQPSFKGSEDGSSQYGHENELG